MAVRRVLVLVLIVGVLVWAGGVRLSRAAEAQNRLEGRVYRGETGVEPPGSTPIQGVTVSLYCSGNQWELGSFVRSTTTDEEGWYGLEVYSGDLCDYYNIVETNLPNYVSVGATTVGGSVIDENWIQYVSPLEGQTPVSYTHLTLPTKA